jgi:predicted MFS family arabinose efflux permease
VLYGWWSAAPFLGDAVSFLASAVLLLRALPRRAATVPVPGRRLLDDVLFGLRWFLHQRLLRLLAAVIGVFAFCQAVVWSVLVLYGVRILHLSKAGYGIFLAVAAIGNVAGGVIAGRVHAKIGPFWSIVGAGLLAGSGFVLLSRTSWVGVAVIGVAIQAVAVAVGNVATLSLRHAIVPTELLGRVNNAFRTCVWGVMPLGALAGGVLASQVGLHTTFLIAGVGQIGAIVLASRLLALRIAAEPALHRPDGP